MNTRNRLVNFRVTDEELRRLKNASALKNARCLSEFARSIILECAGGLADAPVAHELGTVQFLAFDRRLARLESTVTRLVDALESVDVFAVKSPK